MPICCNFCNEEKDTVEMRRFHATHTISTCERCDTAFVYGDKDRGRRFRVIMEWEHPESPHHIYTRRFMPLKAEHVDLCHECETKVCLAVMATLDAVMYDVVGPDMVSIGGVKNAIEKIPGIVNDGVVEYIPKEEAIAALFLSQVQEEANNDKA